MTRLFVVRHGQTDWNVVGRLQGSTDIPLNDAGLQQARVAAQTLVRLVRPQPLVISSPLSRALDTAAAFAELAGVPVETDERLMERAYGVWEGRTMAEIEQQWPAEFAARAQALPFAVDGMETDEETGDRVAAAAREHADRTEGDVVLFTHGSAGRMGVTTLLGLPRVGRALGNLANTAWSVLERRVDGAWRLERHSVTAYDVRSAL